MEIIIDTTNAIKGIDELLVKVNLLKQSLIEVNELAELVTDKFKKVQDI